MNAKKNKCKFFASSRKGDISFRRRRYFEISLVQEDMYALEIGWGMLTYPSFYKPSRYALKKNDFYKFICCYSVYLFWELETKIHWKGKYRKAPFIFQISEPKGLCH